MFGVGLTNGRELQVTSMFDLSPATYSTVKFSGYNDASLVVEESVDDYRLPSSVRKLNVCKSETVTELHILFCLGKIWVRDVTESDV